MKKIAVLGAGRSSSSLIRYLLVQSESNDWRIKVYDRDLEVEQSKIASHPNGEALKLDVFQDEEVKKVVSEADLIVSMLPARMHIHVIEEAINQKKKQQQ